MLLHVFGYHSPLDFIVSLTFFGHHYLSRHHRRPPHTTVCGDHSSFAAITDGRHTTVCRFPFSFAAITDGTVILLYESLRVLEDTWVFITHKLAALPFISRPSRAGSSYCEYGSLLELEEDVPEEVVAARSLPHCDSSFHVIT